MALTTLLDEAAFWLGRARHRRVGHDDRAARDAARGPPRADGADHRDRRPRRGRPRADDPRYSDTTLTARDADGRLVASAAITFVAVRGAARRLVTGMLAINAPELLRRVFPSYTPAA